MRDLDAESDLNEYSINGDRPAGSSDQVAYLQQLLDAAHREIAEYKSGFVEEIRLPLLMELIGLAHRVEHFLLNEGLTAEEYRDFLHAGVLADIHGALGRYEVEPFICGTQAINRSLQRVDRVVETRDSQKAGQVRPLARGYALRDRVLHKEDVALYKLRGEG